MGNASVSAMKWEEVGEIRCSVARTLSVVGDRWTLLVIRDLHAGPMRFGELLSGLPGLASNLLTSRLAKLQVDVAEGCQHPALEGAVPGLPVGGQRAVERPEGAAEGGQQERGFGAGGDFYTDRSDALHYGRDDCA